MFSRSVQVSLLFLAAFATAHYAHSEQAPDLVTDIKQTLHSLERTQWKSTFSGKRQALVLGGRITLDGCQSYPYHDNDTSDHGFHRLANDLLSGLQQGLQCMAGDGPMGRLHPYHEKNALRLLNLLNDESRKVLSCVEDQTFAYAVAHPAKAPGASSRILIDTYRVSGFLSPKFDRATYRDFFNLSDPQIKDYLTGKPLHVDGMHRYRNLPALMFHEVTHWLGFEHTNLTADVVDLYEICCFAGSDYISNEKINRGFQKRACGILKDAALWQADKPSRKRLWKTKGYIRLKRDIRQASE